MKEENLSQHTFSENSNKSLVRKRKSKKKSKDSEKFFNFNSQSNKTNLIQNEKFVKHEESLFKNQTNSYNIHLSHNYKEELYKKFSVFLQSKKFKISNQFDEKNSKKFLDSKNDAMEEIQLNDELLELDTKNKIVNNKKDNNKRSKYGSSLKLKTQYVNVKTTDTDNKLDYNTTHKIDNDNSNDSNFIYKFILDNANVSEEIFLKKLKNQMKSMENKNRNSAKNFSKFADSKIDKGKQIINKRQSLFKGQNPFKFSDLAKNLMINEKIEASSIKSSSSVGSKNKNNKRNNDNEKEIVINDNILKKDAKNKINKSIDDIEIDSDKESIINILSSFVNK